MEEKRKRITESQQRNEEKRKPITGSQQSNEEKRRKPITESQQGKRVKLERTELPDEIILEILSRLPVKSLLRFKQVCKRWLSIISDPNFRHKKEYESILVLKESKSETLTASICSIDDNKAVLESSFPLNCNGGKLIACSNFCHGLVIIGLGESLFLFNPSTRYFAKVLSFPKGYKDEIPVVGLCYDASINDYKIVVGIGMSPMGFPLVVASLKTKRWGPVGFPSDYGVFLEGPIVNERMHWVVEDKKDNDTGMKYSLLCSKHIMRYDPSANIFEEFPSPPNGKSKLIFCLGVLGGCICMARMVDYGEFLKDKVEVLIMKEYGVRESWTTLFCFSLAFRPTLITNNWEIFLTESVFSESRSTFDTFPFAKNNGEVLKVEYLPVKFAYNLKNKTFTDLVMIWSRNYCCMVMSFVQTLASPPVVGCE